VCPVQLPGRGSRFRERPFERIADLVGAAAAALDPLFDRSFALFGHSMGALVAFELARELRRRRGPSPALLLLAAHEAPHRPPPLPPFSHLPDDAFLEEVRLRYEGIPDEVLDEPELLELLLPVLRADISALENYVFAQEEPLDCPLSCFGGNEDRHLSLEDLEAWREQTSRPCQVRMLAGNHFFLETARGELLRAVAEDLGPWLNGSTAR
jgi:medium-chain acyl-[acyl-carrier-protein] hydrolase